MNKAEPKPEIRPRKKWLRFLLLGLVLLLVVVAIAPWMLAKTSLRDSMLRSLVNSEAISISSRDASFGYFSPLMISGLSIRDKQDNSVIEIEKIRTDRSWLNMLFSRPELGTITVEQPNIDVTTTGEAPETTQAPPSDLPILTAAIKQANVRVRTPQTSDPVIDLKNVNVTFRIQRTGEHSEFVVDPILVFDHQPITPELCNDGLQLVAPMLADELSAKGEFSFQLDKFRIPVGLTDEEAKANAIEIRGIVQLHSASVGLKNPLTQNILDLAFNLLDEKLPSELTVAENVAVQFHVKDGRVFHEGLAFVLPHEDSSLKIESSGSVGLDESLDLQVAVDLPDGLLGDSALAKQLTGQPINIHVGGTLDEPDIGMPTDQQWASRLIDLIGGEEEGEEGGEEGDELAGRITELVGGLLDEAIERAGDRPPNEEPEPLFPRLRDRLKERRERRNQPR